MMVGGMVICVSICASYANVLIYSTQELELGQGQTLMRHLIKIKPFPLI